MVRETNRNPRVLEVEQDRYPRANAHGVKRWISSIATLCPTKAVYIRGLVGIHPPKIRAWPYPVRGRAQKITEQIVWIASLIDERFALFHKGPDAGKVGPHLEYAIPNDLAGDLLLVLVRFRLPHDVERRKYDRASGFH